jgi:CheY-like chemotaxis protein
MITVLYVDTDPKMWTIISHIFEKYGTVSVFPAGSGEEALGWLSQYYADVIVSDIDLPGMSAIQFLHTLRSKGISLPFIFFSEHGNPHLKNEICTEEVFGFVTRNGMEKKPILNLLRQIYCAAGAMKQRTSPCRDMEPGT